MAKTYDPKHVQCSSFEELSRIVNSTLNKHIFIYFSGDIDKTTGLCWCPDCNKSYPIIDEVRQKLNDDILLITCYVGDRTKWKSSENDFRKESPFKIERIPTLLNLRTGEKIIEDEVSIFTNVEKFISK